MWGDGDGRKAHKCQTLSLSHTLNMSLLALGVGQTSLKTELEITSRVLWKWGSETEYEVQKPSVQTEL